MNSYRCMKLKLSRRADEDSDSTDPIREARNHRNVGCIYEDKAAVFCGARSADAAKPPQELPGLTANVTPPPSPGSGHEDHVDKDLCSLANSGPRGQNDVARPFLSPAPTDEEDADPAKMVAGQRSDEKQHGVEGNGEVLGLDKSGNGDASRKGDIFKCSFCERTFSYLCHLKVHERVHTGEKPYSCKFCSTQFSQLGSLTVHMRIHTGEKPYQCNQCSKRFRHINSLRRHQRQVHTGSKRQDVHESQPQTVNGSKTPSSPSTQSNVFFNSFVQHQGIPCHRFDPRVHGPPASKANSFYPSNKVGLLPLSDKYHAFAAEKQSSLNGGVVSPNTTNNPTAGNVNKKTSIFKSIEHLLGLNEKASPPQVGTAESNYSPPQVFEFSQPWGLISGRKMAGQASPAKRVKADSKVEGHSFKVKRRSHSDDGYSGSDEDMHQNESTEGPNKFKPVRYGLPSASFTTHQQVLSAIARTRGNYQQFIVSRKWSEDSGIAIGHETNITANA